MTVEDILKATFTEMAQKGMLEGINPVFDGYIDLEVTEPRAKVLVLAYLSYEDISAKFNYAYEYRFNIWGFPEINLEENPNYPFKFPFLATTVLDHWNNHRQEFPDKVLVRFLRTEWGRSTSDKNKSREEIKKKGYDADKVIFIPIQEIEENVGEFVSLFYFKHLGYITTVGAPHRA